MAEITKLREKLEEAERMIEAKSPFDAQLCKCCICCSRATATVSFCICRNFSQSCNSPLSGNVSIDVLFLLANSNNKYVDFLQNIKKVV